MTQQLYSWVLILEKWELMLTQNLYVNIYISFIHNTQTWKQSRYLSIDEWLKNVWYILAIEFYWAEVKTKQNATTIKTQKTIDTYNNLDESPKYAEWKKLTPKFTYSPKRYDFVYVTF